MFSRLSRPMDKDTLLYFLVKKEKGEHVYLWGNDILKEKVE